MVSRFQTPKIDVRFYSPGPGFSNLPYFVTRREAQLGSKTVMKLHDGIGEIELELADVARCASHRDLLDSWSEFVTGHNNL